MQRKIVCFYSGGKKSLACLFAILSNPEYKEYLIQIHYIHIVNHKQQYKQALDAVKATLPVFKEYFQREFIVTENQINFSCLPAPAKLPADSDICLFIASQIINIDISVRYVALGFSHEQLESNNEYGNLAKKISANLASNRENPYSAQDAEYLLPCGEMSDVEIVATMSSNEVFRNLGSM